MATFSIIDVEKAPEPVKKNSTRLQARMHEYENYLMQVPNGKVGRIRAGSGESVRGIALRLSRAGKRMNRQLEVWSVEDAAYFKPLDEVPTTRGRGKPKNEPEPAAATA